VYYFAKEKRCSPQLREDHIQSIGINEVSMERKSLASSAATVKNFHTPRTKKKTGPEAGQYFHVPFH